MTETLKLLSEVFEAVLGFMPKLTVGIFVLVIFWLAGSIFLRISHTLSHKVNLPKDIRILIGQVTKAAFLLAGLLTALAFMGIKLSSLITALGLTGFALGVALKDVLANLLSGLVILLNRPFKIKDRIGILEFEGRVVDINLRYTVVETQEGPIFIPNQVIFANPLRVLND
ncbi:MAG: mechanosensitive ion channel [Actinomycetota bacterium]|nr:mechanosensitive ion channel [Actinomycetota bacterium]